MENTALSRKLTPIEEASDPATGPERLKDLAGWRGEVGRAVASNPNTPTYLLVWLAKRYCVEVLRNPVLPLLLLEDPGLPLKLPVKALRGILRDWEPPGEFLHPLKRHPDPEIREAARLHVANKDDIGSESLMPEIELKGGAALPRSVFPLEKPSASFFNVPLRFTLHKNPPLSGPQSAIGPEWLIVEAHPFY